MQFLLQSRSPCLSKKIKNILRSLSLKVCLKMAMDALWCGVEVANHVANVMYVQLYKIQIYSFVAQKPS